MEASSVIRPFVSFRQLRAHLDQDKRLVDQQATGTTCNVQSSSLQLLRLEVMNFQSAPLDPRTMSNPFFTA
jgi:hypothetical protein